MKRCVAAIRHISWAKHSSERLREALTEVLGERQLGEASTRLVVPAWSPSARSVYVYKTAHHPRLQVDYLAKAVDAAMATASAPTYFRQHVTENDVGLIEGGVWANNPVAIAVVEAVTLLGWPPESLHVLSLGCLDEDYSLPAAGGWGTFNKKLVMLLMDGQAHSAMGMAKLLTGHEHEREAIYRIDHTVKYGEYGMDDARLIRALKGLGFELARDRLPAMQRVFLDAPAEAFTPEARQRVQHIPRRYGQSEPVPDRPARKPCRDDFRISARQRIQTAYPPFHAARVMGAQDDHQAAGREGFRRRPSRHRR